jgi:hypothetical protein
MKAFHCEGLNQTSGNQRRSDYLATIMAFALTIGLKSIDFSTFAFTFKDRRHSELFITVFIEQLVHGHAKFDVNIHWVTSFLEGYVNSLGY